MLTRTGIATTIGGLTAAHRIWFDDLVVGTAPIGVLGGGMSDTTGGGGEDLGSMTSTADDGSGKRCDGDDGREHGRSDRHERRVCPRSCSSSSRARVIAIEKK